MENNRQSFYQFSDQLRVQTSNLANLSLNDSIWSNSLGSKRPDQRRNFDIRVGAEVNNLKQKGSDLNSFNDGWNPISDLKPKGSDMNLFNDGWNPVNDLKAKGSNLNLFNDGWNPVNDLKAKGSNLNLFNDGWNPVNDLKAKGSNLNLFNEGWNSVNDSKPKGSDLNVFNDVYSLKPKGSDLNVFNDGWKMGSRTNNYGVSPIVLKSEVDSRTARVNRPTDCEKKINRSTTWIRSTACKEKINRSTAWPCHQGTVAGQLKNEELKVEESIVMIKFAL